MSHAIDRMPRFFIACAFAAALMALPLAFMANAAAQTATAPPAGNPAQQMAALRSRLGITPAQQPQFNAFAQAMQQNEAAMAVFTQRNPPNQPRNALDQLRAQAQAAQLDAQGLRRLVPVFQALYASLSDQQKRVADQLFAGSPPSGQR
jgi:periplasmic protein CpxP/Spy